MTHSQRVQDEIRSHMIGAHDRRFKTRSTEELFRLHETLYPRCTFMPPSLKPDTPTSPSSPS